MKEHGWIEPIVERVVGQVLDSHAAQLRTEIVRQVMAEIATHPSAAKPTTDNAGLASGPADLAKAVAEIQLGSSQKEILRALLDTTARYAARVALFVVKGNHATGWQARGFANSDGVKDFQLDRCVGFARSGLARTARAFDQRMAGGQLAPQASAGARGQRCRPGRSGAGIFGAGERGAGFQRSFRGARAWPRQGGGSGSVGTSRQRGR
jgi:hypothetical protein